MLQAIGLFYVLFLLTQIIAAIFVVYHLKRYTLNHSMASFMITMFAVVFIALLSINVLLFFQVPWGDILPSQVFM